MKIKKEKKEVFYICPSCKHKQTTLNEWQNYWICYEMDLATQEYEKRDMEEGKDDKQYLCPECGNELQWNLIKKFYE